MGTVIRWGILGTGQIARTVAQDFRLVPEAVLLAVGSRDQTRAQAFARHHGIAKAYGSYEDLLQDRDIDVVYIATPQMRHRDDALACIGSGKAVLCEKPFTLNAREARTVIQAARRRGVFCMEAMWMRFIPLIREVKTRIDQGAIGDITHLRAEFGNPRPYDPQHRHFNPHLGGGCLLERGVYPISLAFYLLGRPAAIESQADMAPSGVDLTSDYRLHYDSGAEAVLGSSNRVYRPAEATIRGTAGEMHIHAPFLRPHRITMRPGHRVGGKSGRRSRGITRTRVYQGVKRLLDRGLSTLGGPGDVFQHVPGHGYQFELEAVTHCLQRGEQEHESMPLDETLAIIEVMDDLRRQWGLVYPSEREAPP
jgi:predicted dehydrogenase